MSNYVIIPAHNESENIEPVITAAKEHCANVIVVDDGSVDDTLRRAEERGAVVLRHTVNLGKGAALKTGCDYALTLGADKLVVMDADGQHEAKEIPKFLEALQNRDIVFGYRKKSSSMPLVLRFGNGFINTAMNSLFGVKLTDTQCGYRAFTADAYRKVRWSASDYYMETEMIIKTGKNHLKYVEMPTETIYSDRYKGTTVIDGMKIVLSIALWRFFK